MNILESWPSVHNRPRDVIVDYQITAPNFVECNIDLWKSLLRMVVMEVKVLFHRLYETLISCDNIRSLRLGISRAGCEISNEDPLAFDWN